MNKIKMLPIFFLFYLLNSETIHAQGLLTVNQTAPWPVIHQNLSMTKESPFCAPTSSAPTVKMANAPTSVVNLHGNRYLYSQVSLTNATDILAFDPNNLSVPAYSYRLSGAYPDVGGGVIDNKEQIWWTSKSQLVRLSEDLTQAVVSPKLPGEKYNGTTILPDGNMLVTSMPLYSVVSTVPKGSRNKLSLQILMIDGNLENLDFGGFANPTIGAGFGPRPVTDGLGSFYFVLPNAVFKVTYDTKSKKLGGSDGKKVDWVFWAPQGEEYGISDGVIIGKNICFNSVPVEGQKGMKIRCLDKVSGQELGLALAFEQSSSLIPTWHTLGASGDHILLAISDSKDGSGGLQAFDLSKSNGGIFSTLWLNNLPNISESFVVSSASKKVYISSRKNLLSPFEVLAIDLVDGTNTKFFSGMDIDGLPGKALSFIGLQGTLYVPTSSGILQIKDAAVPEVCK